jgi:hypothetical protein
MNTTELEPRALPDGRVMVSATSSTEMQARIRKSALTINAPMRGTCESEPAGSEEGDEFAQLGAWSRTKLNQAAESATPAN